MEYIRWPANQGSTIVLNVGTFDSQTPNPNGALILANSIYFQSASASVPGMVNVSSQTFAGNKTFTGSISASNFSGSSTGTNTGDVTLAAVGSSPNANGASLSGQVLTLQPADGTHPGLMSALAQTIGGVKTFSSAPNFSSLTASTALVLDGSNNVASLTYLATGGTSNLASRDANGNTAFNNAVLGVTSGSSTPVNMTAASTRVQIATGISSIVYNLPDATTLAVGHQFEFNNNSTATSTINKHDGTTVVTTAVAGSYARVICTSNSSSNGLWDYHWLLPLNTIFGSSGLTVNGTIAATNLSGTNTGDVTLSAFGNTPNANGASLSGQALTLQPADGTHPGGVSTTAQTFAGIKTFSSAPNLSSLTASLPLQLDASNNVVSTAIDLSGTQATGTLAAGRFPALTGDITTTAGSLATTIAANAVTNAKLAQMTAHTFKGNNTGATANAADLTQAQLTAELNQFTTSLQGVVPGSGGGTANFLRADGTWAAPTGTAAIAPTVQAFTSGTGTYTRPTSPTPLYIKIKMVGGGGGGQGSNTGGQGSSGSPGGNTTFGTSLLTANGGAGGTGASVSGGTTTVNSPAIALVSIAGSMGQGQMGATSGAFPNGGNGGCSPFGGAGAGSANAAAGGSAVTNSGSGGGGAGGNGTNTGGGGGAAGGYIEAIINSPSSSYSYAVGTSGEGGSGTAFAGGPGGSGYIVVEEHYQ